MCPGAEKGLQPHLWGLLRCRCEAAQRCELPLCQARSAVCVALEVREGRAARTAQAAYLAGGPEVGATAVAAAAVQAVPEAWDGCAADLAMAVDAVEKRHARHSRHNPIRIRTASTRRPVPHRRTRHLRCEDSSDGTQRDSC